RHRRPATHAGGRAVEGAPGAGWRRPRGAHRRRGARPPQDAVRGAARHRPRAAPGARPDRRARRRGDRPTRAARSRLTGPAGAVPVASIAAVTAVADLPLLASGKVREMYRLDGSILMVASDRISTYDVVHPTPIPDKGKVLTGLSAFWFRRTVDLVPNHFVSATEDVPAEVRGRALTVRRLEMLPLECVVRGYLSGSGWKDYQQTGAVCGIELPD